MLPFITDEPVRIKYGDKTWKRKAGELLRPDAYSDEQVEEHRAMVGPPDFETLFQQNAKGVPWAALSDHDFPEHAGPIPQDCPLVVSIDPAQTARRKASYSVIQAWAAVGDSLVLMEQFAWSL